MKWEKIVVAQYFLSLFELWFFGLFNFHASWALASLE
jgi:hypothetical protein